MNKHVLIISGSARTGSKSRGIADAAYQLFTEQQGYARMVDLSRQVLPVFNGDPAQNDLDAVRQLRQYAVEAAAFFIVTPEYHNGISGALKNALDYLNADHFRNKPVAIAATSGGGKGGINALNNLRIVLRGVYANVLPGQYAANPEHFDEKGTFVDAAGIQSIQALVRELIGSL
jgi:azobenzene reductase